MRTKEHPNAIAQSAINNVAISAIVAITLSWRCAWPQVLSPGSGICRHSGYIRAKVADENYARTDKERHQRTPVMISRKNGVRSTLGQVRKTVQAPKW